MTLCLYSLGKDDNLPPQTRPAVDASIHGQFGFNFYSYHLGSSLQKLLAGQTNAVACTLFIPLHVFAWPLSLRNFQMANGAMWRQCRHCYNWGYTAEWCEGDWYCHPCFDWWSTWAVYWELWYVMCVDRRTQAPVAVLLQQIDLGVLIASFLH